MAIQLLEDNSSHYQKIQLHDKLNDSIINKQTYYFYTQLDKLPK